MVKYTYFPYYLSRFVYLSSYMHVEFCITSATVSQYNLAYFLMVLFYLILPIIVWHAMLKLEKWFNHYYSKMIQSLATTSQNFDHWTRINYMYLHILRYDIFFNVRNSDVYTKDTHCLFYLSDRNISAQSYLKLKLFIVWKDFILVTTPHKQLQTVYFFHYCYISRNISLKTFSYLHHSLREFFIHLSRSNATYYKR